MPEPFEDKMCRGGESALVEVSHFFEKNGSVHQTLRTIAARLSELDVQYTIIGGMALVAHGYNRSTADVDVSVSSQDIERIFNQLIGSGYERASEIRNRLRDTATGVRVDFFLSGTMPGEVVLGSPLADSREPATIEFDGIRYPSFVSLLESKLACALANIGRLKYAADAQQLIPVHSLPADFEQKLNPFVREKFRELLTAIQTSPDPFEQDLR